MPHLLLYLVRHIDQSEPIEHSVYVSHSPDISQSFWTIAQKFNCTLNRLDYMQEQGLMSSLPLANHLGYDLRHYHAQHYAFIKQFNLPAHFQFDVAAG